MGPDRIAAGITSLPRSSSALYSTSAKPNFQFIFNRSAPIDTPRVRVAQSKASGEDNEPERPHGLQLRVWLERERVDCAGRDTPIESTGG
jgi:hypothetical protein